MVEIIKLDAHRSFDPKKDFYDLPLSDRYEKYSELVIAAADKRKGLLKDFADNESSWTEEKRLSPEELTEELKSLMPRFDGKVVGRLFPPSDALHYIVEQEVMDEFFPAGIFERVTGKVICLEDELLAPEWEKLAGLVIMQAKSESEEKDMFIAMHEEHHVYIYHLPNSIRRQQLSGKLTKFRYYPYGKRAEILIGLHQAIQIDETAVIIASYNSLGDKERQRFRAEFIGEFNDCARRSWFELDDIRRSGRVTDEVIQRINQYERASMEFPYKVGPMTLRIGSKLMNPERLEPLGYAMSYVTEALQVLDYHEIDQLEEFCVEVLEPTKLRNWSTGFAKAASKVFGPIKE